MGENASTESPPIVPHLKRDDKGRPYLQGSRCDACGHVYVGERNVCARCYARNKMTPVQLSEKGKLYAYTIVHRSFPGVDTPFIDVIVDLEDGAHIKGILKEMAPEIDKLEFDMPVKMVYREIVPPGSKEKYLSYFFVPGGQS
jgi:uncharacterized OB-fold protein